MRVIWISLRLLSLLLITLGKEALQRPPSLQWRTSLQDYTPLLSFTLAVTICLMLCTGANAGVANSLSLQSQGAIEIDEIAR